MMCGRFRHLKPEFQLIDFCIPEFRHESSTMRFKGQFSQPVVQGGIRMPGTSHAAPTCKRETTSARSSVGGACILRLHFLTDRPTATPRAFDPKSKANGLRALPPWTQNGDPIPQPEVGTRRLKLHSIGLKRVAATQGNGLRANCRCPALATVLATEVHQGRTTRNMLQGRCQPPPTFRRMVSNPCRYAVRTTARTPFRTRHMPVLPGGWTSARSGVPDARSMCALA